MSKTEIKASSDPAYLEKMRHTLAHVLAQAVTELYGHVKLGVGPTVEHGFYYDMDLDKKLGPDDLAKIEEKMREIVKRDLSMEREEVARADALKRVKKMDQPYKVDIINDLPEDAVISFYTQGDFVDLCRGNHVDSTGQVGAFKLDKVAGAYWRGDDKNKMLQRVYGLAFASEAELKAHLKMMEEAEKRDHRKLGKDLDLFVFSDLVGPGLPLWTPKGTLMRNLLDDYVWSLREAKGYQKVEIPHITKKDLYEKSGHWDKFKDELFKIQTREGHTFAMKPMNCPHHTQIYARTQHSYRDLPQRYANTTVVYRDEQTGELSGLSRVRSITQDDAHVFCRASQAKEEILKVWDIVEEFYGSFGFKLKVRLSLSDPAHPEKYLGTRQMWDKAEDELRTIARGKKADFSESLGEAAFYGPKVDFMSQDSIGRPWQVATVQLDVNMPERFDLSCINEKGEKERIVMIHAAIMGSIERFVSVLIEHFAGALPVWMSPVQVALLPVSVQFNEFAGEIAAKLRAAGLRVEIDAGDDTVGKKIRAAEKLRTPYMIVLGEKEKSGEALAVRVRGQKDMPSLSLEDFVKRLQKEVAGKK
ncbi:threonine--tRNA ligase [Candidatus Uhrbacteria bacterium]|nr:threonine--tRNA ligase [Candidatus Uhrbacteria bacterium]